MATPAVPTLGATFLLTNPDDILAYGLRHFSAAPKNATATHVATAVSLADILSRYGHTKDQVAAPIVEALTALYNRIFQNTGSVVTVTTEDITEVRYGIVITVAATVAGQTYRLRHDLTVENGQLVV